MSFPTTHHIETAEEIDARFQEAWDFVPSDGHPKNHMYAVMSIVCPQGTNQRAECFGIKCFGSFPTEQEAVEYSQVLHKENNFFDYFVMKLHRWHRLPPEVEKLEDIHYGEEQLNKLRDSIVSQRKASAQMMEQRILEDKRKKKEAAASDTRAEAEKALV